MRLLLDSADISEIREFFPGEALAGVTTNPSLIAKQPQRDYIQLLQEIDNELQTTGYSDPQHFSAEVTTLDPDGMIDQAFELRDSIGKHVHVKIPLMPETIRVIEKLSHSGVQVNATACMTALQAKIASDAGADAVSFFYNRMKDGYQVHALKEELIKPLEEITLYCSWGEDATVICGSIRHPRDIVDCWQAGAYLVTAPAKVIREALRHPKTTEAIGQFQKDIEAWRS